MDYYDLNDSESDTEDSNEKVTLQALDAAKTRQNSPSGIS